MRSTTIRTKYATRRPRNSALVYLLTLPVSPTSQNPVGAHFRSVAGLGGGVVQMQQQAARSTSRIVRDKSHLRKVGRINDVLTRTSASEAVLQGNCRAFQRASSKLACHLVQCNGCAGFSLWPSTFSSN